MPSLLELVDRTPVIRPRSFGMSVAPLKRLAQKAPISASMRCPTLAPATRTVPRAGRLDEELERLSRIPLLIVDEVGYIPFDREPRLLPEGYFVRRPALYPATNGAIEGVSADNPRGECWRPSSRGAVCPSLYIGDGRVNQPAVTMPKCRALC
jgi:hypothetical protein